MKKSSRKLQIGVMGSAADLKYSKKFEKLAEDIGYWVAKKKATLVFGAEKDYDSLSTAACRGAKKARGFTIGITYGKGLDIFEKKNKDTGGWSEKLGGQYLDGRNRMKIEVAGNPKSAVDLAIKLAKKKYEAKK